MPDIAIVTDSNSGITQEEAEQLGIVVVPMPFFIDDKIDTGAMILNKKVEIAPEESAGELHDKLMHLGKEAVLETLQQIEQGSVQTTIQPNFETKTAYKLNKENTKIN